MQITYDTAKCQRNVESRGIHFELAQELDWSTAWIVEDTRHDYGEQRFQVLGLIGERLHALVFTPRGAALHIISLRKANSREVRRYEQARHV